MSSYHRNRCCSLCFICGACQPRYDHYCALTKGEQRFFQQHFDSAIPADGCMCRAHRREAQRHRSDPEYIPIWKKVNTVSTHDTAHLKCGYPQCTTTSLTERIIVPSEETQAMFSEALDTQHFVTLCETHYQRTYRQMHAHNPCAGCGAKPKARQAAYTRHSPDAVTISQYLTERTGFDVNLTLTDTVCKACYDMHLVVMQHIESQASAPHIQFQSDIKLWSMKMYDENTNELTKAVLATVAKKLEQDRALLPHAVPVLIILVRLEITKSCIWNREMEASNSFPSG